MLTPSSICNLSRAVGCAARAPGPMLFVVARGVVAFAGRRGVLARGARRVLLPGPRRFCWQVRKVTSAGGVADRRGILAREARRMH